MQQSIISKIPELNTGDNKMWDRNSDEFKMFSEFYQLCKKWYGGTDDKDEYNRFIDETNDLYRRYKSSGCASLTWELCLGLNKYIDNMYYESQRRTGARV